MMTKIVSGAQTGVDRAALDCAMSYSLDTGGWCPKGRVDELGLIPEKYKVTEVEGEFTSEAGNYAARTKQNIIDSDGTLIIVPKLPLPSHISDGTMLTIKFTNEKSKPHLLIDLSRDESENIYIFLSWIRDNEILTLNVAGPRESSCKGIYDKTLSLLGRFIESLHKPTHKI